MEDYWDLPLLNLYIVLLAPSVTSYQRTYKLWRHKINNIQHKFYREAAESILLTSEEEWDLYLQEGYEEK